MQQFTQSERGEVMDGLAEAAGDQKPRLFCLHGIVRHDGRPFIGWGIEFSEDGLCCYLEPPSSTTHLSGSAAQLVESFSLFADVRLAYLD